MVVIGQITQVPLSQIKPSPQNDALYKPVDKTTPAFKKLVRSIRKHGILQPLTLTLDDVVMSGHRRFAASHFIGLRMVPCVYVEVYSDAPNFVELLKEHNEQRIKTIDEQLREAVVDLNPDAAYRALVEHREKQARIDAEPLVIEGEMKRRAIGTSKQPLVDAIWGHRRKRNKLHVKHLASV